MSRLHYLIAAASFWKALRKAAPLFARGSRGNPVLAAVGSEDPISTTPAVLLGDASAPSVETEPSEERTESSIATPDDEAVLKVESTEVAEELAAAKKELADTKAALEAEEEKLRQTEAARIDAELRRQIAEVDESFLMAKKERSKAERAVILEQNAALRRQADKKLKECRKLQAMVSQYNDMAKSSKFDAIQLREASTIAAAELSKLKTEVVEVKKALAELRQTYAREADSLDFLREQYDEEAPKLREMRKNMKEIKDAHFRLTVKRDEVVGSLRNMESYDDTAKEVLDANGIIKAKTAEITKLEKKVEKYDQTVEDLLKENEGLNKRLLELEGKSKTDDISRGTIQKEGTAALCWREARELLCDLSRSTAFHRTFVEQLASNIREIVNSFTEQAYVAFPFLKDLEDRITFLCEAYSTDEAKENGLRQEMEIRDTRVARIEEMLRELAANETVADSVAEDEGLLGLSNEDWAEKLRSRLGFDTTVWDGIVWEFDVPWDSKGRLPGDETEEESSDSWLSYWDPEKY